MTAPQNPTVTARYAPPPITPEAQQPTLVPTQPIQDRLMSVSSVVDEVRRYVTNMSAALPQELPEWLQALEIPPGWQVAQIGTNAVPLSRVILSGHKPEGGWEGCETLSLFRFSGAIPPNIVEDNAQRTLRDLDADNVNSYSLTVRADASTKAVRSSGYFTAGGRRVWAQYSTYVGQDTEDGGFLIEHAIYIDSAKRPLLRHDIEDLGDAVHSAFLDRVDTVDTNDPA